MVEIYTRFPNMLDLLKIQIFLHIPEISWILYHTNKLLLGQVFLIMSDNHLNRGFFFSYGIVSMFIHWAPETRKCILILLMWSLLVWINLTYRPAVQFSLTGKQQAPRSSNCNECKKEISKSEFVQEFWKYCICFFFFFLNKNGCSLFWYVSC